MTARMNADPNVVAFLMDRPFTIFTFAEIVDAYMVRVDGLTETHVKAASGWSMKHIAEETRTIVYNPEGRITVIIEH